MACRAACYTKLGAWNEGLKDAEECIRLEPSFAKGYSRKGHLQYFMKVSHRVLSSHMLLGGCWPLVSGVWLFDQQADTCIMPA